MKKCPFCQQEIQDDAIRCRFCAEMLIHEPKFPLDIASLNFPSLFPGYVLAAIFLLFRIWVSLTPMFGDFLVLAAIVLGLGGFVYWCICVYKIHKVLLSMSDHCYPISPGRAVGFGFIPFFSLYWAFKWPAEIIHFVRTRSAVKTWKAWVPGLLFLLSGMASRIDGALWFLLDFGILSYLVHIMKQSLAVSPEPTPYKSKTSGSVAMIVAIISVCMIPVMGILAAIAIPNLLKARMNAQEAAVKANLNVLSSSMKLYELDNGKYPTEETQLPEDMKRYKTQGVSERYQYFFEWSPDGTRYAVTAKPKECGKDGTKIFKITSDNGLSEEPCLGQ